MARPEAAARARRWPRARACRWWESNPHVPAKGLGILSPARLPVSPHRRDVASATVPRRARFGHPGRCRRASASGRGLDAAGGVHRRLDGFVGDLEPGAAPRRGAQAGDALEHGERPGEGVREGPVASPVRGLGARGPMPCGATDGSARRSRRRARGREASLRAGAAGPAAAKKSAARAPRGASGHFAHQRFALLRAERLPSSDQPEQREPGAGARPFEPTCDDVRHRIEARDASQEVVAPGGEIDEADRAPRVDVFRTVTQGCTPSRAGGPSEPALVPTPRGAPHPTSAGGRANASCRPPDERSRTSSRAGGRAVSSPAPSSRS